MLNLAGVLRYFQSPQHQPCDRAKLPFPLNSPLESEKKEAVKYQMREITS